MRSIGIERSVGVADRRRTHVGERHHAAGVAERPTMAAADASATAYSFRHRRPVSDGLPERFVSQRVSVVRQSSRCESQGRSTR